jgi:hypothetical protein
MGKNFRRFQAFACLASFLASPAWAETRAARIEAEEASIPKKPSAPPTFDTPKAPAVDSFQCPRIYVYRQKRLNCDSNLGWDGENLRTIIQDTPSAVAELDAYQKNRREVQSLRYVGSLGLAAMLAGFIAGKVMDQNDPDRIAVRNGLTFGGGAVLAGSLAWGLFAVDANDAHLGRAVRNFNQTHPTDPIELQFSTGVDF